MVAPFDIKSTRLDFGTPRDSISVLEALPRKFDIKNTHLVFYIYLPFGVIEWSMVGDAS